MTFGSLFTGIGGLDVGLERAGFDCRWQVEIDKYATRVLERHWPNIKRWGEVEDFIRTIRQPAWTQCPCCENMQCSWHRQHAHDCPEEECPELEYWDYEWQLNPYKHSHPLFCVDAIVGGFPCQPISVAGRQLGDRDQRWLWPAFRDCIRLLEPRWVLVENVPGLLSADAGRLFGGILRDLAQSGYDASWQVLPAAAFGAPHIRERVFLIAYRNAPDPAGAGLQERDGLRPRRQKADSAIAASGWWDSEPAVGRVANGIPSRVDRLKCLGNAVVPQVAEWIGRQILNVSNHQKERCND